MASLITCFHITLLTIILKLGQAVENDARVQGATASGDFIIGGIFSFHEDVDKNMTSFAPKQQPCVR